MWLPNMLLLAWLCSSIRMYIFLFLFNFKPSIVFSLFASVQNVMVNFSYMIRIAQKTGEDVKTFWYVLSRLLTLQLLALFFKLYGKITPYTTGWNCNYYLVSTMHVENNHL